MYTSRVSGHVDAPRAAVYRALLSAEAIARWRVPTGMRAEVHEFDAREGGGFRVSLTYEAADASGKSAAHTDTTTGTSRGWCRTSRWSRCSSSRRPTPRWAAP